MPEEIVKLGTDIHLHIAQELLSSRSPSTSLTMSARKPASSRFARVVPMETEAEHDQGLAEIMRLTDYLGDARRAAIALIEKHGIARALEVVDGLIAECGQNDSPHAVEMGAMWMMVRNHIADGLGSESSLETKRPTREEP